MIIKRMDVLGKSLVNIFKNSKVLGASSVNNTWLACVRFWVQSVAPKKKKKRMDTYKHRKDL
jgi:hypothetical protein